MAACTSNKNIIYLSDLQNADSLLQLQTANKYLIRTSDILYVNIISINKEINDLYNVSSANSAMWNSETSLFVNGYSVDLEGNIALPVIGKVNVKGLTIFEARSKIQEKVDQTLTNASVFVKLVSFKVTVLGEVNFPGVKTINKDCINIFEVLGMAGDITSMGDKRNVLLIRQTENGTLHYSLDLTKKETLTGDHLYLMPNDILYINPVKAYAFQANGPSISIVLSFLSATVSIVTLTTLLLR